MPMSDEDYDETLHVVEEDKAAAALEPDYEELRIDALKKIRDLTRTVSDTHTTEQLITLIATIEQAAISALPKAA